MSRALPRRDIRFATFFFFLSGAAALVYQVAWQRLLGFTTGVAVHSVAIITAAFMAGLGIGSHVGGNMSARMSRRKALVAFGVIELAVAAFAAVSVPFYYGLLYRDLPQLYDGMLMATITHFLSLLPPTALMGMSLPFLVRGLVRDQEDAPRTIGLLYGANALGASAGAFLTPWLLIRFLGVTGAIWVGACGSALAGLGSLLLARSYSKETTEAPASDAPPASVFETDEPSSSFQRWVILYALSGFVSLSLEVVWFRVLDVAAKGGAFAFGTLLSVYLLGLAAGTFVAARGAARIRRPLTVFLTCQIGVVVVTVLAHTLLVWLPADWPGISWIVAYGKTPYGVHLRAASLWEFFVVYLGLPLALFGPSTFLMGFGFPVLQRATQTDPSGSGRTVGLLQAANIAGCTLGSLFTGLVLLDTVGTAGVFKVLTFISFLIALGGLSATKQTRFAWLAAGLLLLGITFPSNEHLWLRIHGDPDPKESLVEEDAASVTLLTPEADRYKLWINGRHNSWLPYGWLHTAIGAFPALVHPNPIDVAVIGMGSGDTAWAAASRAETQHEYVFEIASSQPRLMTRISVKPTMSRVHEFLSDPRITIVKDDGRRRLHADGRKYDIIVADAIDTDSTMSNTLYSVEFYRLVADTLKPGGLMCVLAKTTRIRAAAQRAFPYAVTFRDDLLLVSSSPIVIDKEGWIARLHTQRMIDYLGKARTREIAQFIEGAAYAKPTDGHADVNWDLEPKDEFVRPFPAKR
ncbi:MAG: fused MFS/spermidine synthase [Vicinamibacteria bacterium]